MKLYRIYKIFEFEQMGARIVVEEKRATKSEQVYEELYRAITRADIPPRAKLSVKELAKEYNVSEIPVREALQRLASEEVLEYVKYVGYRVPPFSMERIRWLWEIKVCLEVFASQLAVENCGREELRKLHENIAQTYEIIEAEKWGEFEGINRKFHMTVYECSQNPFLCKEIVKYWNQTIKVRGPYSFKKENVLRSVAEHEEIVKALEEKDAERVKKMIYQQRVENWRRFSDEYRFASSILGKDTGGYF